MLLTFYLQLNIDKCVQILGLFFSIRKTSLRGTELISLVSERIDIYNLNLKHSAN